MKLTAIILAGGNSSRMGHDKGLVLYQGKRMVEHVVETCSELASEIFISTNNPEYSFLKLKLIKDNYKGKGPIGGLQAALAFSDTIDNIICPCDMPGIQPEILKKILAEKRSSQVVVAANPDGKLIPVLGYFNRNVLSVIEKQISKGDYKMQHLLEKLDAKSVVFPANALKNINTPEELQ